jgi:hypothetical protein
VLLDRALGDDQPLRDAGVREPLGHQGEDLALARSELVLRVAARAGDELGHDLGVERRPPAGDTLERVEEVAHVGHALLQQVPDAARLAGEQLRRVPLLDVLREHEDGRVGSPPDLDRRA